MPPSPMASGHGGTVRLRKGQLFRSPDKSTVRETSSLAQASGKAYANLNSGPVPNLHTATTEQYVTYCLLERQSKSNVDKTVWIKNTIALLRGADPHAMILPYDPTATVNAITHPNQVPPEQEVFRKFFPRVYMNMGKMVTKCKIQTSIPIKEIKWSIMPQLQNYKYYITPTQLRALRTGKAGYFLYAHPELTHRSDFNSVLSPLLKNKFNRNIEFQVAPEKETITLGQRKMSQRVLMVRGPLEDIENLRAFFSEAFSEGSPYDIGFLVRYTFITSHPVGACTKHHLYSILKQQQHFHRNVHYFIMYGIENLDTLYTQVRLFDETSKPTPDEYHKKQSSERSQERPSPSQAMIDDDHSMTDPTQEATINNKISLRLFMYMSMARNQTNLFHAVYPSSEKGKIYVLTIQENHDEALSILHNLKESLSLYMRDSDISKILVGHKGKETYIKDYPKPCGHYHSYANALVDLTLDVNPQDDISVQIDEDASFPHLESIAAPVTPKAKRNRDGEYVNNITPNSKLSRLPEGFSQSTSHDKLNATITESIARMRNLEQNHTQVSQTLKVYGEDIATLSTSIKNNSEAIKTIQEAQQAQMQTMESFAKTQERMHRTLNSIAEFNKTIVQPLVQSPEGVRGDPK